MTRIRKAFAVVLIFAVLMISANASYITLQNKISMEEDIQGTETYIKVTLTNLGDEAAHFVQLSFLMPQGFNSEPIIVGDLNPNVTESAEFKVQIDNNLVPGTYSIALLTEYKDANGYPFSSVTPSTLVIKQSQSSQLTAVVPSTEVNNEGGVKKITLSLWNLDKNDHEVEITVFSPQELRVNPNEKTVQLKGRSNLSTDFEIVSLGALAGASYVIFASFDYVDGGAHYSSTAYGIVKVVKNQESGKIPGTTQVQEEPTTQMTSTTIEKEDTAKPIQETTKNPYSILVGVPPFVALTSLCTIVLGILTFYYTFIRPKKRGEEKKAD